MQDTYNRGYLEGFHAACVRVKPVLVACGAVIQAAPPPEENQTGYRQALKLADNTLTAVITALAGDIQDLKEKGSCRD